MIGVPGFLQNRADYLLAKDDEVDAWGALAQSLWDKSEGQKFTASEALEFFKGGMTGDEWHGPVELGTTNPAKMANLFGRILSKQMATRTFKVVSIKHGKEDFILVKLVYKLNRGTRTYQMVEQ